MVRSMVARQFAFGYPGFGMGRGSSSSRRLRRPKMSAADLAEAKRRREVELRNLARQLWWQENGVGDGWFK